MATFVPPTVNDVPPMPWDYRGEAYDLMKYFGGNPRGRSVLLSGGHYTTIDSPLDTQLTGTEGIDWFLGGHVYTVSTAVAAALVADGYTVT